jgi:hypothetical protein
VKTLELAKVWTGNCCVLSALPDTQARDPIGAHIVPHSVTKYWALYADQLVWDGPGEIDEASNLLAMEKTLEEAMDKRLWCLIPAEKKAPSTRFRVHVFCGKEATIEAIVAGMPQKISLTSLHGKVITMPDYVSRTALQFRAFYTFQYYKLGKDYNVFSNLFRHPTRDSPSKENGDAMKQHQSNQLTPKAAKKKSLRRTS